MFEDLPLAGLWMWTPRRFSDSRGWFCESYSQRSLAPRLVDMTFVQDNLSLSIEAGTVRGLHYQLPPFAQDKLIRVSKGAIRDVVVDLRRTSPTFGRHAQAVLRAEEGTQIFVPRGFAHGFVTLEPGTEVAYKTSALYSAAHERGVLWSDPRLGIDWGIRPSEAKLSDKDKVYPCWDEVQDFFA